VKCGLSLPQVAPDQWHDRQMALDARASTVVSLERRDPSPQDGKRRSTEISFSSAFPIDTTAQVRDLLHRHSGDRPAQEVSFRQLVPWLKVGERATHYLHPYPAKLLPHIAHFFLATEELCSRDGLVLDPFGGSGTVAVETCLSGRPAAYVDSNPLARLIAEVKLRPLRTTEVAGRVAQLKERFSRSRASTPPPVVNIDKWFSETGITRLTRLKSAINRDEQDDIQRLFLATFSAVVRKVSRSDPRLSVPVSVAVSEEEQNKKDSIWERFEEQLAANLKRVEELSTLLPRAPRLTVAGSDARHFMSDGLSHIKPGSVELIITSPPYAGAQKYIRASSLCLGWLGMAGVGELRPLEKMTIGREHLSSQDRSSILQTSIPAADAAISRIREKNATRAAICAIYLQEMQLAVQQMHLALKRGGHVVLIIGNNEVCGEPFLSSDYLTEYFVRFGFEIRAKLVDEIKSRGLMTKRNKTASVITREWVLIFRKK